MDNQGLLIQSLKTGGLPASGSSEDWEEEKQDDANRLPQWRKAIKKTYLEKCLKESQVYSNRFKQIL